MADHSSARLKVTLPLVTEQIQRPELEWCLMEQVCNPAYAVTLIHGTFASHAAWTRSGSALRGALEAAHGKQCLFEPFDWSGANNVFERILAAQALITHLDKLQTAYPGIRHILIAHSHGGNLALQAESHGKSIGPIEGICCLATPFFHARLREESVLSAKFLQSVFLALLSVPYLVVGLVVSVPLIWSLVYVVVAIFVSATIGGYLSGGVALRPLGENIVNWTHARCSIVNLKIIRASGDEASLVLSIGQLTAWASRFSIKKLARAERNNPFYTDVRHQRLPSFIWTAALATAIIVAVAFGLGSIEPKFAAKLLSWLGTGVTALTLIILLIKTTWFDRYLFGLAAIALILSMLLNRTLIGTSLPSDFRKEGGWVALPLMTIGSALLALIIDLNAESAPEGEWQVETVPPLSRVTPGVLAHSIYDHPVAIARIVAWLGEICSEVRADH